MLHKEAAASAAAFLYGVVMKKKKLYVRLLDLGLVALALTAKVLTGWMLRLIPACPFALAGVLCPACGGTRCVRYFFSGQFAAAFWVNPFFFVLIWYLAAALVLLNVGVLLKARRAETLARAMTGWQAVIVCAALFAIFGVVRNFM